MMLTPAAVTEGTQSIAQIKGNITFKDVSFRYINESNHILNKLNFEVP